MLLNKSFVLAHALCQFNITQIGVRWQPARLDRHGWIDAMHDGIQGQRQGRAAAITAAAARKLEVDKWRVFLKWQ